MDKDFLRIMPNVVPNRVLVYINESAIGIAIAAAAVAGLPFSNQHIGSCAFYGRITANLSTLYVIMKTAEKIVK